MRYLYLSLALMAALTSCSSGVAPAASTGGVKSPPSSTQAPVNETPVNPAPTVPVNPAPTVPV
ncbi:hypothetical protein, partial [Deinococcus detaillensis]|uniref:hypothetical protein n=1 Tax=Deinococcus detaillensis TaxID=2592048 RepID=UPI001CDB5062